MHTQLYFKSTAFPKYEREGDEIINATRWGKRLAEFLRDTLPKHGVETGNIHPEDWGWLVEIPNEDLPLWIGCGPTDGLHELEQTGELIEFSISVIAEPSFLKRLFKRIDTAPAISQVVAGIKEMIASSVLFQDPQWSS